MTHKSASIMSKITTIYFLRIVSVYTLSMTFFVQPTFAPVPKTKDAQRIALMYAGILVVMVVAQLFTFEHFLVLMTSFGFPGEAAYGYFWTAFLVTAEVLALPFLLRMPLSPAFRWVSIVSGWAAAAIWLKITILLVVLGGAITNVGFLGTVVDLVPGVWAILVSLVFVVCAVWATWGMWPRQKSAKTMHAGKK